MSYKITKYPLCMEFKDIEKKFKLIARTKYPGVPILIVTDYCSLRFKCKEIYKVFDEQEKQLFSVFNKNKIKHILNKNNLLPKDHYIYDMRIDNIDDLYGLKSEIAKWVIITVTKVSNKDSSVKEFNGIKYIDYERMRSKS